MDRLIGFIPFVTMATDTGKIRLNSTRIIEAVIIAAIGGIGAGYVATKELKVEIGSLKTNITQLSHKVDCLDDRLWQHQSVTERK